MRRTLLVVAMSLLGVIAVAPAVAAHRHQGDPQPVDPTIVAEVSNAAPCGPMWIVGGVEDPDTTQAFDASAVVHFTDGDVQVDMRTGWHHFMAHGRARVPNDQAAGPVSVDVTIDYAGEANVVNLTSTIVVPDNFSFCWFHHRHR